MAVDEARLVLPLILAIGVHLIVSVALWGWARWVARRLGGGKWRLVAWAPLAALGLAVVGGCTSGALLVHTFSAVVDVDLANKATFLVENISDAMSFGVVFTLSSLVLYLGTAVALLIGSLRAPRPPR